MSAITSQGAPYAGNPDETDLDTTTGTVTVAVTIVLNGTIANVQADWASLVGLGYASPSAVASYAAG